MGLIAQLPNEDPFVTPGIVTFEDFDVWKAHYGEVLPGGGAGAVGVPEPTAAALLLVGACLMALRLDTLRGWTHKR